MKGGQQQGEGHGEEWGSLGMPLSSSTLKCEYVVYIKD